MHSPFASRAALDRSDDRPVSPLVAGQMRIKDLDDAGVRALFDAAREAGVTVFDHAEIYGGQMHACEARFAEALRLSPAERDEIVLQSKTGIVPGQGYDLSYEHIVTSVTESLRALRTDRLDVLLLHRPDPLVEPDEVARAFDHLAQQGMVRHFGVSNHTPGQIELLAASLTQPIVANQLQISLTHCPAVAQGMAANMETTEQALSRDLGILDFCRLHDITVQAWSPFQARSFDGVFLGHADYPELNAALERLADGYGVTPDAVALAWLTTHPGIGQVVAGTTRPERLHNLAAGVDITLSRPQWYELFRLAGHVIP